MAKSMTGYGRSQFSINGKTILVEIKSVNHRYFEFSPKTPKGLSFLEDRLKTLVAKDVSRGKVDLYLSINFDNGGDVAVKVNSQLAKSYYDAACALSESVSIKNDITANSLIRIPDIFTLEKVDINEEELWNEVSPGVTQAVERFCQMRESEGERLQQDLLLKLSNIETLLSQVEEISPQTVKEYREKLFLKLKDILEDNTIDENRILTEAAFFAEKVAVDEETVRLKSHLVQFREILKEDVPVGRKLDFLTQEINREVNTIGSKAQDLRVAKIVVELKSEIEKIREQIQNLE